MIREMIFVRPATSSSDIQKVEQELGIALDVNYKQFLLQYNGGRPKPNCFDIDWNIPNINSEVRNECRSSWGATMLKGFFPIGESLDRNLLEENRITYKNRIPKAMIAIGDDVGGNALLLGVTGEHTGKIFFWVSEHEQWEGDDSETLDPYYDNVGLVANSFLEFINEKLFD